MIKRKAKPQIGHPDLDSRLEMQKKTKLLILSNLFNVDRVLLYTPFLLELSRKFVFTVWTGGLEDTNFPVNHCFTQSFDKLDMSNDFPKWINKLRHMNNYLWDAKGYSISRNSAWEIMSSTKSPFDRMVRQIIKHFSNNISEVYVEQWIANFLIQHSFLDKGTKKKIEIASPTILLCMCPFISRQMQIVAYAKQHRIPCIAYIPSWDNLSTKNRLIFDYDAYIVWSEEMKKELQYFYKKSLEKPVIVVGAPQYDMFFQATYHMTRQAFFARIGLDEQKQTITYCLGSPLMLHEDFGALEFVNRASNDDRLKNCQIIIRTHPSYHSNHYPQLEQICKLHLKNVIIQDSNANWSHFVVQTNQDILDWVNTIRYSDLIINFTSTILVDASIMGKPVINLDFDPEIGQPNAKLVHEVNHNWNHSKPIIESGGVWLVKNYDEMLAAAKSYLDNPSIHEAKRKMIVNYVAGPVDGRASQRMADAIDRFSQGKL